MRPFVFYVLCRSCCRYSVVRNWSGSCEFIKQRLEVCLAWEGLVWRLLNVGDVCAWLARVREMRGDLILMWQGGIGLVVFLLGGEIGPFW